MASVNPLTKEILLKIVYYGPGLGGKTTTLQYIHRTVQPEHRGKMVSLATPVDRTLYFDFLPIRLPKIGDYILRLQMFTVPGQVHYNATRKLVLTGADGVVLVADSQRSRMDANVESLENLRDNLIEQKIDLDAVPFSFQYNKRDLPNICSVQELEKTLNPSGRSSTGTCAISGEGVFQGLEVITKEVLRDLKRQDIFARQSKTEADRLESEITFKKDDQSLMSSIEEYSESSSQQVATMNLDATTDEELTAVFPAVEQAKAMSEMNTKRTQKDTITPPPRDIKISPKRPGVKEASPAPSEPMQDSLRQFSDLENKLEASAQNETQSLSFSPMWSPSNQDAAIAIERVIAKGDGMEAIGAIWQELKRLLSVAGQGVPNESAKEVAALLGIDGRSYLEMANLAHQAETSKKAIPLKKVLNAYLLLIQAVSATEKDK
jgi:signal recognition particle receptor subunit beta